MTISPTQVKEARKLLGWSRPQLAARAGLSTETIELFENGACKLSFFDASLITGTLESVGVEFVADRSSPGVRLRKPK